MKCNLLLLKLDGTCRSNLINNTQLKFPNTNISCSNAPSFDDSKICIYIKIEKHIPISKGLHSYKCIYKTKI